MIKNYFKIAFRNISRNLGYTFLNVFGLTLGVAACLAIFLIVLNELGYDSHNSKADRTYRVTLHALDYNANVSMGIIPTMRTYFPQLEHATQVFYQKDVNIKIGENRFAEKNLLMSDSELDKLFDYQWLAGNHNTALSDPNSVVLTESLAKKYFPHNNAMGQLINFGDKNAKVTGVIKDVPANTSLPVGMILSLNTYQDQFKRMAAHFWNIAGGSYAYIVIPQNYSIHTLEKQMPDYIKKTWGKDVGADVVMPLQPLKDVHFDQRYINNIITPTSKDTYYALIGVALLIIITACINFINLATARAIKRAKEVGVRKVLGASRPQLINQFMGEITVMVLISVLLGVGICALFLSQANAWMSIDISPDQILQPEVLSWIAAITIIVILCAGLYPAFVQSAFQPVDSFKNNSGVTSGGLTLRKGLVVMQFTISQMLIVGTLIVASQMDFFRNQDLGFNKDAVISVNMPMPEKREVFQQELTSLPGVKECSMSSGAPSYNDSWSPFSAAALGFPKNNVTEIKFIDEKYTDMFGLTMLAGQKITRKAESDTLHKVVVNETLMHDLAIQDPQKLINQRINVSGDMATVIGVVKDFQSESKHKKRRACVLEYVPRGFFNASIRLQAKNMPATIAAIGKQWHQLFPDNIFKYEFIYEHIAAMYTQEQKVYTAFQLFAGIAILIGCLGLYGLIAFAASQRTKEVGIRKVLGAPLHSIVGLFTREFALLIVIAFLIAAPLGYFIMHKWLQNFAYHISIGPSIFFVAIASSLVIAAFTTAHQTLKAALANPVKSLRSE
ncbi:FtsX-like permease family protein [Mucilaginibacter corticis]|uniref:FtsX-like permease family protein n=1 Tax=Mucilaginibacter corticis TaxID=2597670 RepID=A0A556MT29_9SPHI|nr:ABC transporter permease [Mucilaginibacter corticis]TSJ43037.1 FtsX-like permease family protein [Mucilaginibacter corticis]